MNMEIFSLCDAATDSGGKLNILGAFDSIFVTSLPAVHPQCAIAARLRFSRIEEGEHKIRLSLMDADGQRVVPDFDASLNIAFRGPEESVATNLIMNLQRVKFEKAGDYAIELAVDGREERSLPLSVRLRPASTQSGPPKPN